LKIWFPRRSAAGRRYCLARLDAPEGLAAGARRRPRRVSLKAPLVIRNALPVAVDVRVLALAPPGDGGRAGRRQSDDFATPRPRDAGRATSRTRTASRGGRERCVVRRATLESGGLLAVAEADATDRAEINRRFGGSPPNFRTPYVGQIDVDSATFWTNRLFSLRSRSTANVRMRSH
jgi:hypothetical protein